MSTPSHSRESRLRPRIAVIGGGISGLAAAHRITELLPSAELKLFEASSRLGGVLDTRHSDSLLIERSADSFITKLSEGIDLCRRLGMADQLIPTNASLRRAMVVRDGRLMVVPDGFFVMSPRKLWPMLTTPVLSLAGKLRLLAEPMVPPRRLLDVSGPTQPPADESVASFVTRRLGRETFERLVQPLLSGIYTADPANLSMAATMPEFIEFERTYGSLLRATLSRSAEHSGEQPAVEGNDAKDLRTSVASEQGTSGARYGLFVAPKSGVSSMVAALEKSLPSSAVRRNTRVTTIENLEDGEWRLTMSISAEREVFDGVIIALPAFAAAELLTDHAAALAKELAAISYAGCAVISLGFHDAQFAAKIDSFGFVVPQVEGRRIIASSFASAKFPGRAPIGSTLVRTFVGGALQPHLMELSDIELQSLVIEELRDLLGMQSDPIFVDIARWPRSMPQYHVGHLERVARIERLAEELPGLALAGNAYRGVGIPQCIRSGETAAEKVTARWRAPSTHEA